MITYPLPKPFESPKSLLINVAHRNHYETVNQALATWKEGAQSCHSILTGQDEGVKRYALEFKRVTKRSVDELFYPQLEGVTSDAPIKYLGAKVDFSLVDGVGYRVCPKCLEDKWSNLAFADCVAFETCPKHKVKLIGACPGCSKPFRWVTFNPVHCRNCQFRMTSLPVRSLNRCAEVELYQMFIGGQTERAERVLQVFKELSFKYPRSAVESGLVLSLAVNFVLERFDKLNSLLTRSLPNGCCWPDSFLLAQFFSYARREAFSKMLSMRPFGGLGELAQHSATYPEKQFFRVEELSLAFNLSRKVLSDIVDAGLLIKDKAEKGLVVVTADSVCSLLKLIQEAPVQSQSKPYRLSAIKGPLEHRLLLLKGKGSRLGEAHNWERSLSKIQVVALDEQRASILPALGVEEFATRVRQFHGLNSPETLSVLYFDGFSANFL